MANGHPVQVSPVDRLPACLTPGGLKVQGAEQRGEIRRLSREPLVWTMRELQRNGELIPVMLLGHERGPAAYLAQHHLGNTAESPVDAEYGRQRASIDVAPPARPPAD